MTSKLTHFSSVTSSQTSSWINSSSCELKISFYDDIEIIFQKSFTSSQDWTCMEVQAEVFSSSHLELLTAPHLLNQLILEESLSCRGFRGLIYFSWDISDQHGLSSEHHTYWGRFDTTNNSSIMYTALRYTWYNWNNISKYPLSLISVGRKILHLLVTFWCLE